MDVEIEDSEIPENWVRNESYEDLKAVLSAFRRVDAVYFVETVDAGKEGVKVELRKAHERKPRSEPVRAKVTDDEDEARDKIINFMEDNKINGAR